MSSAVAWRWACDRGLWAGLTADDELARGDLGDDPDGDLAGYDGAITPIDPPADPPAAPATPDDGPDWGLIDGFTRVAAAALRMAATAARLGQLEHLPDRLDHVAADVEQIREEAELSGA